VETLAAELSGKDRHARAVDGGSERVRHCDGEGCVLGDVIGKLIYSSHYLIGMEKASRREVESNFSS